MQRLAFLALCLTAGLLPVTAARLPIGPGSLPAYAVALPVSIATGWLVLRAQEPRRALAAWVCLTVMGLAGWALAQFAGSPATPGEALRTLAFSLLPLTAAAYWWNHPGDNRPVLALAAGAGLATAAGYYAFLTGENGSAAEHALGYWGIHYTSSTRNGDAFFPLVGALVAGALALAAHRLGRRRSALSWGVAFGLFSIAVILSQARGAWLAWAGGFAAIAVHAARSRTLGWKPVVAAVCVVLLLVASLPTQLTGPVAERAMSLFDEDQSSSNAERRTVYAIAMREVLAHPFGVGKERFAEQLEDAGVATGSAENGYLQVAIQAGWLGAIAFVLLVSTPFRFGIPARRDPAAGDTAAFALGMGGATFLLFNVETTNVMCWLVMSLAAAWAWRSREGIP